MDPLHQFNNFSFSINVKSKGDDKICVIEAENSLNPSNEVYKINVHQQNVESLTDYICRTPELLELYAKLAFKNEQNLSVDDVCLQKESLILVIKFDLPGQPRKFFAGTVEDGSFIRNEI